MISTFQPTAFGKSLGRSANGDAALSTLGLNAYGITQVKRTTADDALAGLGLNAYGITQVKRTTADDALAGLGLNAYGISLVKTADSSATLTVLGIRNGMTAAAGTDLTLSGGTVGTNAVRVSNTTPANANGTGAFQVVGGISTQNNIYAAGTINAAGLFSEIGFGGNGTALTLTNNSTYSTGGRGSSLDFRGTGGGSLGRISGTTAGAADNTGNVTIQTSNGGVYGNALTLFSTGAAGFGGGVSLAIHSTAAGGHTFRSGLSIYSIGAGELRATGDFTTDGRLGANNYGTHALAALTVGDNGYGSYVDSVGLIQYHRNLNNGKIYFRNSGNTANSLEVENTFVNVLSELRIAGTKVLGARGAAVADATGAGDVVAQLNALLARVRAHGLIA